MTELRIGDTERNQAITALGEHLGAGRLDVDEFGGRSAGVEVARTRDELAALFTDLPEPRPQFEVALAPQREPVRRHAVNAVLPLVGVTFMVLAVTLGAWWLFLLSGPVIYAIMHWAKRR